MLSITQTRREEQRMTPEESFVEHLNSVGAAARRCATSIYSELAFHHIVSASNALRDRVNNHAYFWSAQLSALQSSGFVAMGRLYDKRNDVQTLRTLLKAAVHDIGLFSRTALEARKQQVGNLTQADAHAYAAAAFEPTASTLDPWFAELDGMQKVYDEKVKNIRHKVFAHNAGLPLEQAEALFGELKVSTLELLAIFPLRVTEAIWQLYHNGIEPVLANFNPPSSASDILANHLVPAQTSTWEHRHAVTETKHFLDSLAAVTPT